MPGTRVAWNSWPPAPIPFLSGCLSHMTPPPCDVPPRPKKAQSWEKLSSDILSLQSCSALPAKSMLHQHSPLHFAYIFSQPNSAFKGLLFHLLINFYLPRRREDIGDAVCDVCCSLTTLQMKFPLE